MNREQNNKHRFRINICIKHLHFNVQQIIFFIIWTSCHRLVWIWKQFSCLVSQDLFNIIHLFLSYHVVDDIYIKWFSNVNVFRILFDDLITNFRSISVSLFNYERFSIPHCLACHSQFDAIVVILMHCILSFSRA